MLDLELEHLGPGLAQIGKGLLEEHLNDARLGRGELPALDRHVPALAAEIGIHEPEDELRVEHDERHAAQGAELHEVQARGHREPLHVLAELAGLHGPRRDDGRAVQETIETRAQQPREALVDHDECGQPPPHDARVVAEIVGACLARGECGLRAHGTAVDAAQERIDFLLIQNFLGGHGRAHCITKLVKYAASTSFGSPPTPPTTRRTVARVSARSFSMPSRVEIAS